MGKFLVPILVLLTSRPLGAYSEALILRELFTRTFMSDTSGLWTLTVPRIRVRLHHRHRSTRSHVSG